MTSLQNICNRIDALVHDLDQYRPLDAEIQAKVMQKFRLDWNYHSNHLEGNSLDYGETKALILFGLTAQGKPLKDHLEVKGHHEALQWLEEVIREKRPLTENFIRQLHELILKEPYETPPITPEGQPTTKRIKIGTYKTTPNHVRTVTGEIFRFAEPEETPAKMTELIDWFRTTKDQAGVHALILAAEFHYRFIRIHPFDDGNGRLARILMNFILMQKGFPPAIIKTEEKENYYRVLRLADARDLEPFFVYIGEQLIHSLEIMLRGARGEAIEDPDDLDKRIALLKASLDKEKEVKVEKDIVVLSNIVKGSIKDLVSQTSDIISKFQSLFRKRTQTIGFDGNLYPITENQTLRELVDERFPEKDFSDFEYEDELITFKKAGVNIFSITSRIKVHFHHHYFAISWSVPNSNSLEKLYHQTLSDDEIQKITQAVGESIFQ